MVMIEKLDALRMWLVKRLTPMCDADPNALAKYVVALIKKDKSDEELKKLCVDQLEVFLQKETEAFVRDLFESLKTKSYVEDPAEPNVAQSITVIPGLGDAKDQKKGVKRRIQRPSPIRHRSRSPYENRRRRREDLRLKRSRSPRDRRGRDGRYRSHSGSPKKTRFSPKRKSPNRRSRSRSRSPYMRRRRRTRSLSSSRSSSRSPDSSHQKQLSTGEKKTCWDFEKKGFCVLGDKCPYDHGKDPVIVDDSAISSSTARTTAPTVTPITAPPTVAPPPTIPKAVPPPIMPPFMPPPPISFPPMGPPGLRPPIPPPMPPPPGMGMRLPPPRILPPPPTSQPPPGYNPEDPGLNYMQRRQNPTNLVPISAGTPSLLGPPPPGVDRIVQMGAGPMSEGINRTVFNNSAPRPPIPQNNAPHNFSNNSKLIIRKIPPMLNNITKLNEHFSQFGAINNIQVKFENDPQCALVEYAHVNSARAAKRDTGAVLNNRFIVVHWYNPQQNNGRPGPPMRGSVKDRLGTLPTPSQLKYTAPGKEAKTITQNEAVATGGTIFRTIPNPGAVTKAPIPTAQEQPQIDKTEMKAKVQLAQKAAEEKRMARQKIVMQKKIELQKQKRELLQKQMQQQKLFLNKIKMTKDMPANEKLKLLDSLKVLTASIDKLRTSLKGEEVRDPSEAKEKQKQAQKELLDAELDLYNASTTGENTLNLKRKLGQLKMEASSLGIVTGYRGGWTGGYRGRGRGAAFMHRPKRPQAFSASANLDRRPRELRVTGFHDDEKDEIISHLARYGEIENFKFNNDGITCVVKFQTRAQAEVAAFNGPAFKNRRLIIVWNTMPVVVAQPEPPTTPDPEPPAVAPVAAVPEVTETEEEPLVVPPAEEKEPEDDDDDVNVHIGDVTVNYPSELDEEFDGEEELDEDALLAADYDEEDEHIGDVDDDYEDEEIRSWRR